MAHVPEHAPIERILVAVDGSDPARRALRLAIDLARRYEARLTVLHVIAPVFVPPDLPVSVDTLQEAQRLHGQRITDAAVEEARVGGAKADGLCTSGPPSDVIVQTADSPDVGLVVVGSRGLGGVRRMVLGSVSDRVARLSPRPVLVVH